MLITYYYYYCCIIIITITILIITTCTVLGFIFFCFVYFKIKAVIPLTEYVYLQGIHLYQSKPLLAASDVNRELGNMVSGVWLRFISAQSKSPSFSHKNFILHSTDCIDEISVSIRASGHHLDNVSNIHTYAIKPAVSWDPFHNCSRSEASSFKHSQSYLIIQRGQISDCGIPLFLQHPALGTFFQFPENLLLFINNRLMPSQLVYRPVFLQEESNKNVQRSKCYPVKKKRFEDRRKKKCSSLAKGQNAF